MDYEEAAIDGLKRATESKDTSLASLDHVSIKSTDLLTSYNKMISIFNDSYKKMQNTGSLTEFCHMSSSISSCFKEICPSEMLPHLLDLSYSKALSPNASQSNESPKTISNSLHRPVLATIEAVKGPPIKMSYASVARNALQGEKDPKLREALALKYLTAPRSRMAMSKRLLPLNASLKDDFETRVKNVEIVYFRGICRMAFSGLRLMFKELGFDYKDLLHFSFLGGGITGVMCRDSAVASKLLSCLGCYPQFKPVPKFDPSLPLPRVDNLITEHSPDHLTRCREAYMSRVTREILATYNLLVSTVLQRQVPNCADEITRRVKDSHGSRSRGARQS
jgi:hypothetical protein